ncbi:MAG: hypothetical protein ACXWP5_00435 [Bdellovibrionota bacterium]
MNKNLLGLLVLGLSSLSASAKADSAIAVYQCDAKGDGEAVTLTVINKDVVKIGDDRAHRDYSYRPRLNNGLLRFEYDSSDEGISEALISSRLLSGAESGVFKLQNRGEGFSTTTYNCHQ